MSIAKNIHIFIQELKKYSTYNTESFKLKIKHTFHVVRLSKSLATSLHLSEKMIENAMLIGLLHDIGRFIELENNHEFNNSKIDHALLGIKYLFEENHIQNYLLDKNDYEMIYQAIYYHNKKEVPTHFNQDIMTQIYIIRDTDKLDNFRVKNTEKIEVNFPHIINSSKELEESLINDSVYKSILKHELVDIHDRLYPLDYLICIVGFIFDIHYKESFLLMNKPYNLDFIDTIHYKNSHTLKQIQTIKYEINEYIKGKIN